MTRSLRVARNVSTTLITQAVTWLLAFMVLFYLPRYVNASGLGEISLAGSFAGIFGLFSALGIGTVIMRDIPRDRSSAGALVGGSLFVRLPLAVLSLVVGMVTAVVLGYSHRLIFLIGIALFGLIIGVISDTVNSAIRGLETFSVSNVAALLDKCVSSGVIILVCILKGPLWMIVASTILSMTLSTYYMVRGLVHAQVKLSVPGAGELAAMVRAGLPFLSASIFSAIYARSDAIFLSKLSTIEVVGWYALAVRLSGTAMALPTTVCSAMLPPLSALYRENLSLYIDGAARLLNLMVICCVPIAASMVFCSGPLVSLLSHHSLSFRPAAPVVQIYGIAVVLYFLSQGAASAVVACDQEKIFGRAMAIAAVFSIPLTAACIYVTQKYWHNGATGAAVSDLLAELYLVVCYLKILPSGTVTWSLANTAVRATLAALPLVVELCFVPSKFVLLGALPCMGLYAYLCLPLGCLHQKDIELIASFVRGKFQAKY